MTVRALSDSERRGCDYHAIGTRAGRKYKIIYLNRLPLDRLCGAIKYLQREQPDFYKVLRDPWFQRLAREFNGEIPIAIEAKTK